MARELGLGAGYSLDLTTRAPDGTFWDLSRVAGQRNVWKLIREMRSFLVIGSPPCTLYSLLHNLSRCKPGGGERYQAKWRQAAIHLEFCIRVYAYHMARGLHFPHEHPASATSWRVPSAEFLARSPLVVCVTSHMFAFGMMAEDGEGRLGPVYKPTRFMGNSTSIFRHVERRCPGCPEHVHLLSGRAAQAAFYPRKLCQSVCKGVREQIELDYSGMVTIPIRDQGGRIDMDELWGIDSVSLERGARYGDDVSGKVLDSKLVEEARREEIEETEAGDVWKKVPKTEAYSVTGKAPVGTRWVDADKGDPSAPKVRRRLVAQELRKTSDVDMFVATPPIEHVKFVIYLVASSQQGRWSCPMVHDIKTALFYAPALRDVYVVFPREALAPGEEHLCGTLVRSLYGTRDAAANWAQCHTDVLFGMGFSNGASSPCTFYHSERSMCFTVHGDVFVSAGALADLRWMDNRLNASLLVTTEIMGQGEGLLKQVRLPNRAVTWSEEGITWEPDSRHCEPVWAELVLDPATSKSLVAPGVRESSRVIWKARSADGDVDECPCQDCDCVHAFGREPVIPSEQSVPSTSGHQDFYSAGKEAVVTYEPCNTCKVLQRYGTEVCGACDSGVGTGSSLDSVVKVYGNAGVSRAMEKDGWANRDGNVWQKQIRGALNMPGVPAGKFSRRTVRDLGSK